MSGDDLARDIAALSKDLKRISDVEARRVNARVINTIARKAKTRTLSGVSKELGIKNKDLRYSSQTVDENGKKKERMKISRATANSPTAVMSSRVRGIPLIKMSPKQTRAGVKVRGRKVVEGGFIATPTLSPKGSLKGRGELPGSFIGKTQVFTRKKGGKRYGLVQRYVAVLNQLSDGMNKYAAEVLEREAGVLLKRELEYRIAKLTGLK